MAPRKLLDNLSTEDLLTVAETNLKDQIKQTDIYTFILHNNLEQGTKFYSIKTLYFLYETQGFTPISKTLLTKRLKLFFQYKRKKHVRGFLLNDFNSDMLLNYKAVQHEEAKKKTKIGRTQS